MYKTTDSNGIVRTFTLREKGSKNIFVSENNGPFVLKKEDAATNLRDVAELSHTIE